jgi:plasmid stabilization system protein ParE
VTPFTLTPQAADDLFDIWQYIAIDSPESADRIEAAIYQACALVAEGPLRGQVRKEFTTLRLRFWTLPLYPNYLIVYDPATKPLQIIRILHGKRNVAHMLTP